MTESLRPDDAWVSAAVLEHERALVAYALRLTGRLETARDVAQDTFLRLCRLSPGERRAVRPRVTAWLFTVCRNRALDIRRRDRRTPTMTPLDATATHAADAPPDGPMQERETHQTVVTLVEQLPIKQREIVRLRFQHDLTYQQIAEVTELSVSYVGYLLHAALRTLREQMTPQST